MHNNRNYQLEAYKILTVSSDFIRLVGKGAIDAEMASRTWTNVHFELVKRSCRLFMQNNIVNLFTKPNLIALGDQSCFSATRGKEVR